MGLPPRLRRPETRSARMHSAIAKLLFAAACLTLATCGQPSQTELPGEEINCEWFAADDNCWRTSLRAFSGSLPAQDESGQLSADGKRCTYQTGFEVVFVNPVSPDLLADRDGLRNFEWDFEARQGGDFLMAYRQPDDSSLLLETGRGTFLLKAQSGAVIMSCPGGSQFNVPVAGLLQTCPSASLPAKVTSWDSSGMTFVLRGTGGTDLLVFDCLAP